MEKTLVTLNEFKKHLSNYWESISDLPNTLTEEERKQIIEQQREMLDQYQTKSFELPSNISGKFSKLINSYCYKMRYSQCTPNQLIYVGVSGNHWDTRPINDFYQPNMDANTLNELSFEYMPEWSDSYRQVFVSEPLLSMLTICEGDLSITINDSKDNYDADYEYAKNFYKEN